MNSQFKMFPLHINISDVLVEDKNNPAHPSEEVTQSESAVPPTYTDVFI